MAHPSGLWSVAAVVFYPVPKPRNNLRFHFFFPRPPYGPSQPPVFTCDHPSPNTRVRCLTFFECRWRLLSVHDASVFSHVAHLVAKLPDCGVLIFSPVFFVGPEVVSIFLGVSPIFVFLKCPPREVVIAVPPLQSLSPPCHPPVRLRGCAEGWRGFNFPGPFFQRSETCFIHFLSNPCPFVFTCHSLRVFLCSALRMNNPPLLLFFRFLLRKFSILPPCPRNHSLLPLGTGAPLPPPSVLSLLLSPIPEVTTMAP